MTKNYKMDKMGSTLIWADPKNLDTGLSKIGANEQHKTKKKTLREDKITYWKNGVKSIFYASDFS